MGLVNNEQCFPESISVRSHCITPWRTLDGSIMRAVDLPSKEFLVVYFFLATEFCDAGNYYNFTSKTCRPCAAGQYQSFPGQGSCQMCSAGRFQGIAGSTSCEDACAPGYYSDEGATSCTPCPAGTQSSGNKAGLASCRRCQPGTFAPEGQDSCQQCLGGHIAPNLGTGECQACPPGQYQAAFGQTVCFLCSPGYYSKESAARFCVPCGQDFYQPNEGTSDCIACAEGKFTNQTTGQAECVDCPQGGRCPGCKNRTSLVKLYRLT